MTFLNFAMLIGLSAVAVPILIHLLHRRRAKVVDWGAMRFVLSAVAARRRRIRLEEVLLLAMRCLIVALAAVAMARPFLPSRSSAVWAPTLAAVPLAAVLAAVGAAMWDKRLVRWTLLGASAALVGAAITASVIEHSLQRRAWPGEAGGKDVAIVIDGSLSMSVEVAGRTNFARALDEARAVVDACRPADAISVILAGPAPRAIVASPTCDRAEIAAALASLKPAGGAMKVLEALGAAAASLAEGGNGGKKIVLITDAQDVGWSVRDAARWRFLGRTFRTLATPPEIICRTLKTPERFANVAVGGISLSRKVVGTDRDVRINVKVTNTGQRAVRPECVELTIDAGQVVREACGEIAANASETVEFRHRFEAPGRHTITVRLVPDDDLPADNTSVRVVDVIDRLAVLIVDGDPSSRPLESASSFIELALAPRDEGAAPAGPRRREGREALLLIAPETIDAADVAGVADFGAWSVVVLANVAKLPASASGRLAEFVRGGGGLLLAMGDRALPEFYNRWTATTGEPVAPAALPERRRNTPDQPARLAAGSFSHPMLQRVGDPDQSDASSAMIRSYWPMRVDGSDPAVRVAAAFDTSEPALVERKLGKGYVLMAAMGLGERDSNLPALNCFVPMVHEMAYFLAAPAMPVGNVPPGAEVALEFPAGGAPVAAAPPDAWVEVLTPTGRRERATIVASGQVLRVRFGRTAEPGLYRISLPESLKQRYRTGERGGRFVVLDDPAESSLDVLTGADFEMIGGHVGIRRAESTGELIAAVAGGMPGEELWRYFAVALLAALLGEIALTRWIAARRRVHTAEAVEFGGDAVDIRTFRTRARGMLAVPAEDSQPQSQPVERP